MRMSVQVKLIAGFVAVLALMGVVGWMGISEMGSINGMLNNMYE